MDFPISFLHLGSMDFVVVGTLQYDTHNYHHHTILE